MQEVLDIIESRQRVKKERIKTEIVLKFAEADAISSRIAYLFGGKGRRKSDILTAHKMFPELFEEERKQAEKEEEARALELHKAQMQAFAARWNMRRKK